MSLRDRCREFIGQQSRNAILRQGDPVEDLVAFVVSEQGRHVENRLEDALPLCMYFSTTEDREEFISLVEAAKLSMRWKKV